jgi:hypothetical protein
MGHRRYYIRFGGQGQASFVARPVNSASPLAQPLINLLQAVLGGPVDKMGLKDT